MSATLTPQSDATIGQLVAERPGRARIFESFGIDYCCGGKKPLSQACTEKGLNPETVLSILKAFDDQAAAAQGERDWTKASMTELADNIEHTHHAYLKEELPRLDFLTHKVSSRHGGNHPELIQVRRIFVEFQAEMLQHMMKEERVLFPMCRQMDQLKPGEKLPPFHGGSIENPIAIMMHEHDGAGEAMAEIRRLTGDYTPPDDACNTFRAMYDSLKHMEQDLHRHVHKENSVLFPLAVETEARLRA